MIYFFTATGTTKIYALSLHDALPISAAEREWLEALKLNPDSATAWELLSEYYVHNEDKSSQAVALSGDRKSTRLNSSHRCISYAVFCLKKKIQYLSY